MFIQQKNNVIYKVSMTLDKVLIPFWNLARNLMGESLLKERDYSDYDSDFEKEKKSRIEDAKKEANAIREKFNEDSFSAEEKEKIVSDEEKVMLDSIFNEAFNHIHNFYLGRALSYDSLKHIEKSCSLVVYKEHQSECMFFTDDSVDGRFDKEFRNCLASTCIVDEFIKFLTRESIYDKSYNPRIYANVFSDNYLDNVVSITSPFYPVDVIKPKKDIPIEHCKSDYRVWFNDKFLEFYGHDKPKDGEVFEYRVKNSVIALEKGQYFIPLVAKWEDTFEVENRALIVWMDYKNRIYCIKEKTEDNGYRAEKYKLTSSENIFIKAAVESNDFTNLLSHLIDNLYLESDVPAVPEDYKPFFDSVLKVQKLEHLPDYKLYVPRLDEGTILGIYKIHKLEDETEYNLRHMLFAEKNGDSTVYKDCYNKKHNVHSVQILKPQYASFYLKDYFEFFVEEVLKALKEQCVITDYLRNQRYAYKDNKGVRNDIEVDTMVFNGTKVFLLELKTTMHIEHLTAYTRRFASILSGTDNSEMYEFHLISSFAEDKIAVLNVTPDEDGYNIKREGLRTRPYKFDIQIPETEKKLHCLAESSYDRLKAELTRIFQA